MLGSSKFKDLDALAEHLGSRNGHQKVVLCHGVFDLLHVGHIRHLREAREMGDILVVTITPDEYVNKGPRRPAFPQQLRAEVLAELDVVDHVAINRWVDAVPTIRLLRPDIYVKGPDYEDAEKDLTGGINLERDAVQEVGGEIRFTNDITFHSSALLNRYVPLFPPEVDGFLHGFRQTHCAADVVRQIELLRPLKVAVVGEVILDDYVYCDAMAKSGKEPILAMRYLSRELYAGGALAVANHAAAFCEQVDFYTYLGDTKRQEEFVRNNLKENVQPYFIYKSGSPTIVKRRYLDSYTRSKLFAVYQLNDELMTPQEEQELMASLESNLSGYDLVLASDFGHGLITPSISNLLLEKAPFLSVNTQINAANIGFHAVSQYRRADYVCIQENEIRMDCRSRKGDLAQMAMELSRRLNCKDVLITRGKYGTLLYRDGMGVFECPSFAAKVVDRIGAGDAVLALTSLCVAKECPPELVGFIGNLAGAQAVANMGNASSLDRVALLKSAEALLK